MKKDEMQLVTKVCYMYYFQDEIQSKIAKKFNITRQMVSKIIQRARDEGIVEIRIKSPVITLSELELRLEKALDLKDVVVIENDTVDDDHLQEKLGRASGDYFIRKVMSGMNVGIGIGNTIEYMTDYISESGIDASFADVNLVQLIGGINSNDASKNSMYLINKIAKKLHCSFDLLNTPFLAETDDERLMLKKMASTKKVMEAYEELDYGFVEIIKADKPYQAFHQQNATKKYLSTLGVSYLNNIDVVGEICLNYLNDRGSFVDTPITDRLMGINHKEMKQVKNLVGIVGGEESHKLAWSAIQAGVINTLITDEDTARYILEKLD